MAEHHDDKFVVFKMEDWKGKIQEKLGKEHADDIIRLYRVEDAVVMRGQDVFAQAAFFQYAGNIYTTIEILRGLGQGVFDDIIDQLQAKADYFSELGTWAGELEVQLPD